MGGNMEKDLKLIVMKGAKPLGEKVDSYLKKAFKDTVVSMYVMISYLRRRIKWLKQRELFGL